MRVLGIETSCDETAVALIDIDGTQGRPRVIILSNIISSQVKLHAKYGGVVPNLAKREHQLNLVPVLLNALHESGIRNHESRGRRSEPHDSKFQPARRLVRQSFGVGGNSSGGGILDSILEREPELLEQLKRRILRITPPAIDAIGVSVGPGLAPALWVGVNFARALAYLWKKPIIPVNHLEGHIYTNLLQQIREVKSPALAKATAGRQKSKVYATLTPFTFPALCLIVSGGHTELVVMAGYGKYRVIGETLDDAAGEAFDKVARMLGLGFPGGPEIAASASKIQNAKFKMQNDKSKPKIKLPRPMLNSKDFNFSFSGLKTAVLYLIRDLQKIHPLHVLCPLVAVEFQEAVVEVLVSKTVRAAKHYRVKSVMIGGGVAANKLLRARMAEGIKRVLPGSLFLLPDSSLTGDNALMIALAAALNPSLSLGWQRIEADAKLRLDQRVRCE